MKAGFWLTCPAAPHTPRLGMGSQRHQPQVQRHLRGCGNLRPGISPAPRERSSAPSLCWILRGYQGASVPSPQGRQMYHVRQDSPLPTRSGWPRATRISDWAQLSPGLRAQAPPTQLRPFQTHRRAVPSIFRHGSGMPKTSKYRNCVLPRGNHTPRYRTLA